MNLRFEFRQSAVLLVVVLLALTISQLGLQTGLIAAVLIIVSLLAHELGHIVIATFLGVRVKAIGLCVLGAYIRREDSHRFGTEAAIALAGPTVNLVLAIILFRSSPLASFVAIMNAQIFAFNLLPIPGCDGWRAMRSLWQLCFSHAQ
jgi:Zn-dependent protease